MKLSRTNESNARALAVAIAISGLAFSVSAGAEDQETPYTMTAITDSSFGYRVTTGDYEEAIQRITASEIDLQDSFEAKTNLCVAYTKTGAIGEATASCDAAIAELETRPSRIGFSASNLAVALSNRGVLRAVQGELDLARQDFAAAVELRSGMAAPSTNLARLESGYVAGAN